MSERAEAYYWTRFGTNPHWDAMYWRDGYFWDSSDCGYTPDKFEVGPGITPPDAGHSLSFNALREANAARQIEWDADNQLTLAYRGNEFAGEAGEVCNVIKKLEPERLGIRGSRDTVEHLAEELADAVMTADLIANQAGIDLAAAIVRKFNQTSLQHGLSSRLWEVDGTKPS
ncbi:MazG-like family protein [Devosia lacusdianchii]|uniref:MazG-like family protein n=1 Tax=Devosia lacusdianchii TaxID=2917991 RepID=UPI001F05D3A7|nr:MazG-like family protein [Devosia sp. JXJ CY 41]